MSRIVVITGAAGNIGGKLRAHLEAHGGYELRLIDIDPRGDTGIQAADLSLVDTAWTERFAGADAVVHLAANICNDDAWRDLTAPNIDATLNVYAAAARHGVRRVVFASSVWALSGLADGAQPLTPDKADPGGNAYGATKLFGERLGKAYWASHGISSVALRIGGCLPGANMPGARPNRWEEECWLSNRDVCRGLELAINAEIDGAVVVNLVSNNPGSRWSLAEGRDLLGYAPQDSGKFESSRPSPAGWLTGRLAAALRRRLRPLREARS